MHEQCISVVVCVRVLCVRHMHAQPMRFMCDADHDKTHDATAARHWQASRVLHSASGRKGCIGMVIMYESRLRGDCVPALCVRACQWVASQDATQLHIITEPKYTSCVCCM